MKITGIIEESFNFAASQCKSKLVQEIRITNDSEFDIENIKLEISFDYEGLLNLPYSTNICEIGKGMTFVLSNIDLSLNTNLLANLTERISVNMIVTSFCGEAKASESYPISITPYNHWDGNIILLPAFILPNTKAVDMIISSAGNLGFTGYQTRNADEVLRQAERIYASIVSQNILYNNPPASFETYGQKVRFGQQILEDKNATCLDMSLFYAACLENVGIDPILVLFKEHVYTGFWTYPSTETDLRTPLSDVVVDDITELTKRIASGMEQLVLVECTSMCSEQIVSFADSIKIAEKELAEKEFYSAIDVKRLRSRGILPVPERVFVNGSYEILREKRDYDSNGSTVTNNSVRIENQQQDIGTEKRIMNWERKLLDLNLNNSLISMKLRGTLIPLMNSVTEEIGKKIQTDGKLQISSFGSGTGEINDFSSLYDYIKKNPDTTCDSSSLVAALSQKDLEFRIKNLYRTSRNAINEGGANTLFLSIGAIKWYETSESQSPRYAPIILIPVELRRKNISGGYDVILSDSGPHLNISILEKFRQDFGIDVPSISDLPENEDGIDVRQTLAIIRQTIIGMSNWDVCDFMCLGIFSFTQFVMWNDLKNRIDDLRKNQIVNSLIEGHLTFDDTKMEVPDRVSEENVYLPLPTDASQLYAIRAAMEGRSFVLHGPPGTGKSQTITSMIVNCLANGKRVLFVSEKMAALDVVYTRLKKLGLEPFCLQLHSHKSRKRDVLDQLKCAMDSSKYEMPEIYEVKKKRLSELRATLGNYPDELHKVRECGLTLFELIDMYNRYSDDYETSYFDDYSEQYLDTLDRTRIFEAIDAIKDFSELAQSLGDRVFRLRVTTDSPYSAQSEENLKNNLINLRDSAEKLLGLGRLSDSISMMAEYREAKNELQQIEASLLSRWNPDFMKQNPDMILNALDQAELKWALPRFLARNAVIRQLKTFTSEKINKDGLREDLLKLKRQKELKDYVDSKNSLDSYLTQYENYLEASRILETEFGFDVNIKDYTNEEYLSVISDMTDLTSSLRNRIILNQSGKRLEGIGQTAVFAAYRRGADRRNLTGNALSHLSRKLIFRYVSKSETLSAFDGLSFDKLITEFNKLSKDMEQMAALKVYCELSEEVPDSSSQASKSSEIGIIRKAISNSGRGLSIRQLFSLAPHVIEKYCPCFMMSPLSAAQYLRSDMNPFDIVIFDEASQLPTCKAVGVLARGKSAVIVGDPNQMPPTSFFRSDNADEDDFENEDLESILEDCLALGIPSTHLLWHYRSRHESLISFSNNNFYENRLLTFPSVTDRESKVSLVRTEGTFDRGRSRTNRVEAEAIVSEIKRRYLDPKTNGQSIGVVTFNVNQQNLIEDLIDDECDRDEGFSNWVNNEDEPLFVKNLENVQGDERDVIMFSISYGYDKSGKLYLNFGPLNRDGGWKRLNVAVTRSRYEMIVFSSIAPSDIRISGTTSRGVRSLRGFLEYAASGKLPLTENSVTKNEAKAGSIIKSVRDYIFELGYDSDKNVGRSKCSVDVGVVDKNDPEKYILGILLDGEQYGASKTVRDREVGRVSVLEGLGWNILRIWSVDWFNNKEAVLKKISDTLASIESNNFTVSSYEAERVELQKASDSRNSDSAIIYSEVELEEFEYSASDLRESGVQKYVSGLLTKIISHESPVSKEYMYRRILRSMSISMTMRVTERLDMILAEIDCFVDEEGFIWSSEEQANSYSIVRICADGFSREISQVSVKEILNATVKVLNEQFSLEEEDLIRETAKLFGILKLTSKVRSRIEQAISLAQNQGIYIINSTNRFEMV